MGAVLQRIVFMRKKYISILLTLLMVGCSAPISVTQLDTLDVDSRIFVLLNSGQYDSRLRIALAKYGFKLKFNPSTNVVTSTEESQFHSDAFFPSNLRYGLRFSYQKDIKCLWNSEWLIHGVIEVTDLSKNDVVLIIEKGGMTGSCKDLRDQVFPELAKALNEVWNP